MRSILFLFLCLCLIIQTSLCTIKLPVLTAAGEIWDLYTSGDLRDILALGNEWLLVPYQPYTKQKTSFCTSWYFLGGPGVSSSVGYFERTYKDLPTHSLAYYSFSTQMIGTWSATDSFSIIIDGNTLSTWTTANYTVSTCSSLALVKSVGGKIVHSGSSLTLRIAFNIYSTNPSPASLVIKDVYFSFRNSTETAVAVQWLTRGCPTSSSSCSCTSSCQVCFGSGAAQCARCDWGRSDYGSGCGACTANCLICSGSAFNQCTLCQIGYTLTLDGTCATSCPSNSVTMTDGRYSVCISPCPVGQYMMWNWTCGALCDAPLTHTASSPTPYCNYPCNKENGEFLYWNGTCSLSCPFYARNESWYYFCDACQEGYWHYQNGSCLLTCQDNFDQTSVNGSNFCTYPCSSSEYLYPNGSCISTCQLDFLSRIEGSFKFCDYPCQLSEYLYPNGSCMSTCQTTFSQRKEGSFKFCDYPCELSDYLYPNGTCLSYCQDLFTTRIENSYQFCTYPCDSGEYLYLNGSCLSTCQTYFNIRTEGTHQFCDFRCASNEYLYLDGTCSNTCKKYYIQYTEQSVLHFCDYPCTQADYWLSKDGTCTTTSTLSNGTEAVLTGSQKASAILTQTASLLTSGGAITITASLAGRIFFNIKYLNISYSEELQEALKTWSSSFISEEITPNLPPSVVKKIPSRPVPSVFEKYDVCSSFLLNSWESLYMLILIIIAMISLKVFEIFANYFNKANIFPEGLLKKCKIMVQNFFIATMYASYGDLVLYAIIEYRTIQFNFDLSLLSFAISALLLIIMLIGLLLHLLLLRKYQSLKKRSTLDDSEFLENFTKRYPRLQVLYRDYSDKTLDRQMILIRLTIRDIIMSCIITLLFDFPLAQVTLFAISSFFAIFILIDRKPYRSKFDVFQQIYFELIGLSVNVSVSLNAVHSNGRSANSSAVIKNIGKFIIGMNILYNLSLAVLMFLQIFLAVREQWRAYRLKRTNAIIRIRPETRFNETSPSLNPINIDQSVIIPYEQLQPAPDLSMTGSLNSEENPLYSARGKRINLKRRRII